MSPTVFREGGYRFFFFSEEGSEPVHIHIESGDGYAKFWLNPVVLAKSVGFNSIELNTLRCLVEKNAERITEAWHDHLG